MCSTRENAASSDDRNVYLFDLRGNEGDGLCTKLRQDGCAYSVCWNPQNHHFVAVCNEKTGLLVYDLRMDNQ
jgi:WD40 repeat protein